MSISDEQPQAPEPLPADTQEPSAPQPTLDGAHDMLP
jgi:hypothetical protein